MARVPAAVTTALHRIRRTRRNRVRGPRTALRVLALVRRHRARRPHPVTELVHQPHPYARVLGLMTVVLLGAWLGLLIVGNVRVPVGPMDTTMTLRPSLDGGTKINVAPLGALELRSHQAPLRLDVDVDRLDPVRSQALVDHPERLSGLQEEVAQDVEHGTLDLAVRSCVAVVSGATALGLAVYRRPRRALAAGGLALTLLTACGGTAFATWNPDSVLEPKFSGLLSSAPSLVGNARSIVSEFDVYQKELARLVTNVTKLYDVTSTLPGYEPDPTTIRVLHVSDIHLNPASWKIVASLVEQYDINVIVDSGDTMDHGTAAENGFLDPIADLGAPYVWVRGNHDSLITQRYLEKIKNVRVLDDGRAVTVAGLRFAGIGDPSFTPTGRSTREAARRSSWRARSWRRCCATSGWRVRPSTSPSPTNRRRPVRRTARCLWSWRGICTTRRWRSCRVAPACASKARRAAAACVPWRASTPTRSRPRSSISTGTPAASRPGTRSSWAAWA